MSQYNERMCLICKVEFESECLPDRVVGLTERGINTLKEYSILWKHAELTEYLMGQPSVVKCHERCRSNYVNKRRVEQHQKRNPEPTEVVPPKKLRSSAVSFNWKEDCFFCGKSLNEGSSNNRSSSAETIELHQKVIDACNVRNDEWALEVNARLQSVNDIPSVEAVYHWTCHRDFLHSRRLSDEVKPEVRRGRPSDSRMLNAFDALCEWLEVADEELYTLEELRDQMKKTSHIDDVYSVKHLKRKLMERYDDHIFFSEISGRKNVICFRNMASRILTNKWYSERQNDFSDESERIVIAAAKLIKAQIREASYTNAEYPVTTDFSDVKQAKKWCPSLLNLFMENVIGAELKQVSISQAIVQATRPRTVIAPILFGIGVSLDQEFGSQWLLDVLYKNGFSISYDEVNIYKQSVVRSQASDLPHSYPHSFTQWSGDNVDHNVVTLNGANSFHGMGIISMSTSYCASSDMENDIEVAAPDSESGKQQVIDISRGRFKESPVKRMIRCKVSELTHNRGVPIIFYTLPDKSSLTLLHFKPICNLYTTYVPPLSHNFINLVWHTGMTCINEQYPRPNWSGFVQHVINPPAEGFRSSADIRLLPIIDLNPNDLSCIYSTLRFIEKQASLLNLPTACITFDQPLYLKAVEIVLSTKLNVVCRLGGFHAIMSFLGSIGHTMAGSGLTEALQTCYGPVAISHMMTGKAVARSVRGHYLIESALFSLLMESVTNPSEENIEPAITSDDMKDIEKVYSEIIDRVNSIGDEEIPLCIQKLSGAIDTLKRDLSMTCRTAALWLQYMQYIDILKLFTTAERTCDWPLHLYSLTRMLNLFAASGHNNYAKCTRLYLQQMMELPETNPWLHSQLSSGFHSVRRTDRYWAGLSTDLAIEQVMMRALKSRGGLTHGRGMTESVRMVWVKSMHYCATVRNGLDHLTSLERFMDESQHVDMTMCRRNRDALDVRKIINWFKSHNPFAVADNRLHSLSTGMAASSSDNINCDRSEDIGIKIMTKMDNVAFYDVILKKVDQAKNLAQLASKGSSKIVVSIDSSILFSRLLVVMQRSSDLEPFFGYELTAEPTSLFNHGSLRKTDKSSLAKELKKSISAESSSQPDSFVVDGGWLLHKVKWLQNTSYANIIQQYVQYIISHFGMNTTIVFDGYCNGPSIKDHEHVRRSVKAARDIVFDAHMPCSINQSSFLANENNKKALVDAIICQLQNAGFLVNQALNDADTLVVSTALQMGESGIPVTVVANDTDILVLLVYHFRNTLADIFMRYEVSKRGKTDRELLSIRTIKNAIGEIPARQLLVAHAISGCDSTSSLFGIGKPNVWKKITENKIALRWTDVITLGDASHDDVASAGLKLMNFIYGGKASDSLNKLRFSVYMSKTASCTKQLLPERLPPTENAAKYHIYRVHLQVVQWDSLMSSEIKAEDWGWKLIDGQFEPIKTDQTAAPDELLSVVRCKCKTESRRPCTTQLCSCMKHGLSCVAACKNCNGESCENSSKDTGVMSDLESDNDSSVMEDIIPEDDIPWFHEEEVLVSTGIEEPELNPNPLMASDIIDMIPEDCLQFDIPWLEEVECSTSTD